MKPGSGFLAGLERALNAYLAEDEEALALCERLDGRSLAIRVRELDLEFYLLPARHGMQVTDRLDGAPDVRLTGSLRGFARSLFATDAGALLGGDLHVEGDVGLAQGLAEILQRVDFDIEDWLDRRIGEVPSHYLGRGLREMTHLARRAATIWTRDLAEYLREESRDLVHRADVEDWMHEVDRLRADVDRLEARLRRLDRQRTRD